MQDLPDSALISLLKGDDPAARARALPVLGERKATTAVQPLIEAMEDASLRPAVAGALSRMKAEATPVLIRLLKSPEPRHRMHAAFIFGEFRSAAVVPLLVPLLGDLSREVHTAAYLALAKIGEGALGDLRGAIRDPDPNIRIGIANALGRMAAPDLSMGDPPLSFEDLLEDEGVPGPGDGPAGEGGGTPGGDGHPGLSPGNRELAVALLTQLLDDENPHVRDAASAGLHRAGGPSAGSVPAGIDSPDPRARKDAVRSLGQELLFRDSGLAIPLLIEALFDEDPAIRFLAAKGLRYTTDPRTTTPLNACLLDVSPDVRQEAVEGLRRRKDPRTLDPLVHALQDESPGVRRAAASALGEMGDERARDALVQCGEDRDPGVREAAARSLAAMGPDPRLDPHLLIRSPDPVLRAGAVTGLGEGQDAGDLPLITASLGDPDARVRLAAAEALCGFSDPATVPPLLHALGDSEGQVRMFALRALQGIEDPRVLVPLIYALKDTDAQVRTEAVSHLRKIGDGEAVPYLIEALGDPDAGVCREAVLSLGDIGGERTEAVLRELEGRTHDPLKLAAVRTALGQISRMSKAAGGTRGEPSAAGAAVQTAPDQTSRADKAGAGTGVEPSGAVAADRTAPGPISRVDKRDGIIRGEPSGAGAAARPAPARISLMDRPGGTRGGPPAAGASDHVIIARKKNVEPSPPLTLMATSREGPESPESPVAPAGGSGDCPVLWENDPQAARVWQNLLDNAGDFLQKEEFAAAKPLLEKAYAICPDSELLVTRLGITLSSLGRYEEALSVYKRGLAINPRNDAFWSNAGALLANLERYDEALRSYKQALALCMTDEEVWYQTGIVLNNLGRYAEAVKCFDRALLLNPAFQEAAEARRIARGNVWG